MAWQSRPMLVLAAGVLMAASPGVEEMTEGELKRTYLACESASISGRLGTSGIADCSVIYEALKTRAFEGSFRDLKAWADPLIGTPPIPATAPDDRPLF